MFSGRARALGPGPCSSGGPKRRGRGHVLRARPSGGAGAMFFGRARARGWGHVLRARPSAGARA
eukprot:1884931-Alexandrium_andersonii.AAC.1